MTEEVIIYISWKDDYESHKLTERRKYVIKK